jgi:hypothetical protein
MTEHIGSWCRRVVILDTGRIATTRAHLIESEIAGREITRCGRQLAAKPDEPFEYDLGQPADACLRCQPTKGAAT